MMMMIVAGIGAGDTRDSEATMELCDGVHLACVHRGENSVPEFPHSTKCATKIKIYSWSLI